MLEQWPIMTLGELVLDMKDGGTPKRSVPENFGGDINWCVVKDIKPEIFDSREKLTQQGLDGSSAKLWPAGSIIISLGATIGKIGIAKVPTATKQGLSGIVVNEELITFEFLVYVLHHKVKEIQGLATGTTIKEVRPRKLMSELKIPVPPLKEQQRIVCILDEALENISNSTEQIIQKIQNVNALFPSILKSLIPQDVNDCEEVLLGNKEYIQIIDGDRGVNYPKKSEFMNEGHCLFLNTKNVLRNGFNFDTTMFIDEEKDGLLRKGKLQRNDVILTTRGTLGNTAVYHDEIPFNHIRINSGMLMFRPNVEKIYPKYLYHLFTSDIVRSQISSHSRGAAQPHLPVNVLSKFLIPIPKSIDLQKVIVQRLELLATKYDLLLQKLRQEMESFDELRQSILQEAFDGKLTGGITA